MTLTVPSLRFFAAWAVCLAYPVGSVSLWEGQCSSTLRLLLSTGPTHQWKCYQSSTRPEKKRAERQHFTFQIKLCCSYMDNLPAC